MFSFLKKTPATADSTNWLTRLTGGLARTGGQLSALLVPGGRIDEDLYEELETILITADVGMDATRSLLADVRRHVKEQHLTEASQLKEALAHALLKLLQPLAKPLDVSTHKPFVIMLCGVNGAGRTRANRYCSRQATPSAPPHANNSWSGASATASPSSRNRAAMPLR
jgi:fused signal recognition particle receptor